MTTPLCKVCGNEVTKFIKSSNSWWKWCSNKCMSIDPEILEKKRATNIKRYGDHPMRVEKFKEKLKNSFLEIYGVDNPFKSAKVQQKIKDSCIKKYGVENPSKNSSIVALIREKAVMNYNERKDSILEKRRNTSVTNCGAATNKWKHISSESLHLMKDLEWLTHQHITLKKSCQQIANELGVSATPILHFLKINNVDRIRHSVSIVEKEIREYIQSLTTAEILFNDRKVIAPLELDVFVPSKKLGIEVDGVYWHSEEKGKDRKYHIEKTEQCEMKGIKLIHIYDTEWEDVLQQQIIKSKLAHLFNKSARIYARKCEVKEVSSRVKRDFLNQCHLQGNCPSSVNLGLLNSNELVAVATFGKSRYNKNFKFELIRYCCKLGTTIVGGMSKLLTSAVNSHGINHLISYADRRWTCSLPLTNIYELAGFTRYGVSSPNYKYFTIKKSTIVLMSRNQWQKHKLKDKLEFYEPTYSEYENMSLNGYHRIWDCGNLVYEWNVK